VSAGPDSPTPAASGGLAYRHFGTERLDPPADGAAAALVIPPRDGFADPLALVVREDVLAAVGGPEAVRGGALADLAARISAAGHAVESREVAAAPRRPTPAALHREGSARLWLFRRHPERFPLPRPKDVGLLRLPAMALGALHANGAPSDPQRPAGGRARSDRRV